MSDTSYIVTNHYHYPSKILPENAVYIGRPTKSSYTKKHWGNPFTHLNSKDKGLILVQSREEACDFYQKWLLGKFLKPTWKSILAKEELRREWCLTQLITLAKKLLNGTEDIPLVCWCTPKACHGDFLASLVMDIVKYINEHNDWPLRCACCNKQPPVLVKNLEKPTPLCIKCLSSTSTEVDLTKALATSIENDGNYKVLYISTEEPTPSQITRYSQITINAIERAKELGWVVITKSDSSIDRKTIDVCNAINCTVRAYHSTPLTKEYSTKKGLNIFIFYNSTDLTNYLIDKADVVLHIGTHTDVERKARYLKKEAYTLPKLKTN